MRKTIKPIYLTLILTLLTLTSFTQTRHTGGQAQPLPSGRQAQFKFWLAFEDSIGAKDTLWLYADTNAITEGIDSLYGEIPLGAIDSNKFHVYYKETTNDSLNVLTQHPENRWFDIDIQAQNYHLPITVRWDSSLLRNNGLPWEIKTAFLYNTFTFFNPNIPGNEVWDLFFTDTFFLPYDLKNSPLSYYLPLQFYLSNEEPISIPESKKSKKQYYFLTLQMI